MVVFIINLKPCFFNLEYNLLISEPQHCTVSWNWIVMKLNMWVVNRFPKWTIIKKIKIKVTFKKFLAPLVYVVSCHSSTDLVLNMKHSHCSGLNKNITHRIIIYLNTWSSVLEVFGGFLRRCVTRGKLWHFKICNFEQKQ